MVAGADIQAWAKASASVFTTTIAGLAFETIPFLLMGTLLGALLQGFVPDRAIRRIFPRNRAASIGVALLVGIFVPICECGTVPLARRLRDKGLPESTVVAFLLAAPLVNPMTVVSTYVAFQGTGYRMFAYRLGVGLASALAVALLVEWTSGRHRRKEPGPAWTFSPPAAGALPAPPRVPGGRSRRTSLGRRLLDALDHGTYDFFDSLRFLVLGITVASLLRAVLPMGIVARGLGGGVSSAATGAASAFVLCLCSSADAFVARTLFVPASYTAALAFLVLGPMIDLKNAILLSRFLGPKRLIPLALIVVAVSVGLATAAAPAMEALR